MDKKVTLDRIKDLGLLAVIRGPSPELTMKMVDALVLGGVLGIEITYSTPQAALVVKGLDNQYGEKILLGMGTLTRPEQALEAKASGASFLVSPHCDSDLAEAMIMTHLSVMIGAFTPTEVVRANQLGADVVKLFPGSLGGPAYLKSLKGPFPDIRVMPTGGVNVENLGEWFLAGAFAVGAGSELCPSAWAMQGRFEDITKRAQDFITALNKTRAR